jgi:hypothetical protein
MAGVSPERRVLDLTALCWYPFANEHTLMPALGITARNPAFSTNRNGTSENSCER